MFLIHCNISMRTSIQLTKLELAKLEFLKSIRSLPTTNRSELFSSDDIVQKMNFMSGPKPTEHSSSLRWQRPYPIRVLRVLYLKNKDSDLADKRVLYIEELFDAIQRIHL